MIRPYLGWRWGKNFPILELGRGKWKLTTYFKAHSPLAFNAEQIKRQIQMTFMQTGIEAISRPIRALHVSYSLVPSSGRRPFVTVGRGLPSSDLTFRNHHPAED